MITNCAVNYAGLPGTGVSNGNGAQGSIYNVLFVGMKGSKKREENLVRNKNT